MTSLVRAFGLDAEMQSDSVTEKELELVWRKIRFGHVLVTSDGSC